MEEDLDAALREEFGAQQSAGAREKNIEDSNRVNILKRNDE